MIALKRVARVAAFFLWNSIHHSYAARDIAHRLLRVDDGLSALDHVATKHQSASLPKNMGQPKLPDIYSLR